MCVAGPEAVWCQRGVNIDRIEEATHESEEEPDVIAEDAEKAVHRTFEGKKARKKQWSGGRDSRTIRAEKEFAQKEKERLARDAERLAREAAKPKLLEALAPVKRKGGCFNACYDSCVLGLGKYKHVDYSEFTPYLNDFAHLGLKEPDVRTEHFPEDRFRRRWVHGLVRSGYRQWRRVVVLNF